MTYDPIGLPVEIAPGRGDLRFGSIPGAVYLGQQGVTTVGGRPISYGRLFAEQTWVAAVVLRMLTSSVRVPLKCYRRIDANSTQRLYPGDHPLAAALVDPWQVGPGPACQAQLTMNLLGPVLVHGNALCEIDQGANDTIRFDPIDWRFQMPITGFGNRVVGFTVRQTGDAYPIGYDQVLHVAWWSPLGPLGVSPLQQLGVTLQIEDAAQRYQRALFRNGARPPSAITTSETFVNMDPEARQALLDQMREDVRDIYSGPDHAGIPAVLPPGLSWEQVGHTAVEAELIDQRKVSREEICAVYQMPPPMVGLLDRATFSNIEVQREMLYQDALAPPLVLIEQVINAQLVRGLLNEPDIFVEYDFAGVLRGDPLKEIEALREAISIGLLTPNEGRGVLNKPSSKEPLADVLWMPSNNLAPMSEAPADVAANAPAPPEPEQPPVPTPD